MYRLSIEASDHLMEKQMTAYSALVDTAEDKGGNITESRCLMHYLLHALLITYGNVLVQ